MLQHLNVLLIVRDPKLNTGLEVWSHQGWVPGDHRFPTPVGHAISDTSQDVIGLPRHTTSSCSASCWPAFPASLLPGNFPATLTQAYITAWCCYDPDTGLNTCPCWGPYTTGHGLSRSLCWTFLSSSLSPNLVAAGDDWYLGLQTHTERHQIFRIQMYKKNPMRRYQRRFKVSLQIARGPLNIL